MANPVFVRTTTPPAGALSSSTTESGLTGSKDIDGAVGGTLSVGRFTIVVPAGAFAGQATVSITVPDESVVHCQLGITPESANHFTVPVILRSDCSGTDALAANGLIQLWYDGNSGLWVPVPGAAPDVETFEVIAPLQHFSDYGVTDGKAGW